MSIADKVKSLQTLGGDYKKPDPEKMEKFVVSLWESSRAKDYLLLNRNLNEETIRHFGLGYNEETDAIAIPVYKRGELINIKYRFIEKKKNGMKYMHERGCEIWLYNEDGIQKGMESGRVLIVEGEFDLMSVWQAGFINAVSAGAGKDSYGLWLEMLDNIPSVFIAYDNDSAGRDSSKKMADRIGVEKCKEILYPDGVKDANEFFKKSGVDEFKKLLRDARPFYRHDFKDGTDIIDDIINTKRDILNLRCLPFVDLEPDWLMVVSGISNIGKTSYVMNLASELVDKKIPTLVLPFERGIQMVGKRYLQVRHGLTNSDMAIMRPEDWKGVRSDCMRSEIYFSKPNADDVYDILKKAKRIFDVKVVIVDHLEYMVRQSQNKASEIGRTLQEMKTFAEDNGVIFMVVHHLRKINEDRKPRMEDLKDSSNLYQDPECVVLLDKHEDNLVIDIPKNKGEQGRKHYEFNKATGQIGEEQSINIVDDDDPKQQW